MEEDWDYLVILDACRYDYFQKIYRKYLGGELELKKVRSPGSHTLEWAKKVFTGNYPDVVYVSTTPYINSKSLKRFSKDFDAMKHFYKVIDVWDWGWDDKLETVHPKTVNKAALGTVKKWPDKRVIIHYMQPHYPFLTLEELTKDYDKGSNLRELMRKLRDYLLGGMQKYYFPRLEKIAGHYRVNMLKERLGLQIGSIRRIAETYGNNVVRKAYMNNLEIVLSHASRLVKKISGEVVITSDHGELLGEDNLYDHRPERRKPVAQVEVPWLEM